MNRLPGVTKWHTTAFKTVVISQRQIQRHSIFLHHKCSPQNNNTSWWTDWAPGVVTWVSEWEQQPRFQWSDTNMTSAGNSLGPGVYQWLHWPAVKIGEGDGTHSSVLAWRIPGTGEPGGLPSVGSHRVGHD